MVIKYTEIFYYKAFKSTLKLKFLVRKYTIWQPCCTTGANPTIVCYNDGVVKICNATSSLLHFDNKNIFIYSKKRSSLLQRWRCSCKFKKS
jgi:hypothetical protein